MKLLYTSLLIVLTVSFSFAQKQGNNWYFANNCALNFSSGSPSFVAGCQINPSGIYIQEGTSSISDSAGNLLFYTNGVTVWDRNNTIMTHGDSLDGGISTTQSALIVPKPGNTTLFYIFTLDQFQSIKYGLRYTLVDMRLNKGFGDVIPCKKNVLLQDTMTEKLCAMRDSLGNYWILTHKLFSDAFYAYHLTAAGLSAPVVTHIGTADGVLASGNHDGSAFGQMKFSPSGKKVARSIGNQVPSPAIMEVYDFAQKTGTVSNRLWIGDYTYQMGYGIEFSPDNSKLYWTGEDWSIFQYDLLAGDSNAIIASQTTIESIANYTKNGMQLGPDGKIYISIGLDTLAVINNPNNLGTACNYVKDGVGLNGHICPKTLPSFIAGYNYGNAVPIDSFPTIKMNVNSPVCVNSKGSATIRISGGAPPYSITWNTSPVQTDSIATNLIPGQYIATISNILDSCVTNVVYDTIQVLNNGGKLTVNNPTICNGYSVVLGVSGASSYTWSPGIGLNSTTGDTIIATPAISTTYTVIGSGTGCSDTAQAVVTVKPSPDVTINPADPDICLGALVTLAIADTTSSYTWDPSTGLNTTTGNSVIANPTITTTYTVNGFAGGCSATDSTIVTVLPAPNKPIITVSVTGDSLISSATQGNQWYFNDTLISGATNQVFVLTTHRHGEYIVIVINPANGCSATSDSTTGVNRLSVISNQLSIYPNPTANKIAVTVSSSVQNIKEWSIEVTDVLGRRLLTLPSMSYSNEIDLSDFANGVYFITVFNTTGRVAYKAVKE